MKTLLQKLNYKGQKRILIINDIENCMTDHLKDHNDIRVDGQVDPKYPYDFMIIFVKKVSEIKEITPVALHNLTVDGVLWFCYPKKKSKRASGIDRDHGWKPLNDLGFFGIRVVAINEDWAGIRFRNIKHIKVTSERFSEKQS
jgi:hypothetical protein